MMFPFVCSVFDHVLFYVVVSVVEPFFGGLGELRFVIMNFHGYICGFRNARLHGESRLRL